MSTSPLSRPAPQESKLVQAAGTLPVSRGTHTPKASGLSFLPTKQKPLSRGELRRTYRLETYPTDEESLVGFILK